VISLEDAKARVLQQCDLLAPKPTLLRNALGNVTAQDITSDEPVPPFANTAMDGFAVRAADTTTPPVPLDVIGTIAAGSPPEPAIERGQAVRIFTGAPIPPGADAVVMVEDTDAWQQPPSGTVTINKTATVGEHVRPPGDDIAPGQLVVPAGTALTPAHLGVLSSIGVTDVLVYPRARVGVLSTGDELVQGNAPLGPGQIRESNRATLLACVAQANADPVDLGVVGDTEKAITDALTEGLSLCDAIITSGGVSVGDFDFVKVVLDRLSGDAMSWMQVAIKPAKPFAFGVVQGTPVFGLPGNPVSSLVSFECFARPALRQMMGHAQIERTEVTAVADEAFRRRPDGRVHLVRVKAEWSAGDQRFHIQSAGGQASHMLHATAQANALAVLPDGQGAEIGDDMRVLLLSWAS
jgi:molybdenum cofactor synthesis domain-containing protein